MRKRDFQGVQIDGGHASNQDNQYSSYVAGRVGADDPNTGCSANPPSTGNIRDGYKHDLSFIMGTNLADNTGDVTEPMQAAAETPRFFMLFHDAMQLWNGPICVVSASIDLDHVPPGWYCPTVNPQPHDPSPSAGARGKHLDAAVSNTGAARCHQLDDPLDRVHGYLDFRKAAARGGVAELTCLVGTMMQEIYQTHPDIHHGCAACIDSHAAKVESDIAEAMTRYDIRTPWTVETLALRTHAVLQGAFILAKAKGNAEVVEASIDHLHRYVELLSRLPK